MVRFVRFQSLVLSLHLAVIQARNHLMTIMDDNFYVTRDIVTSKERLQECAVSSQYGSFENGALSFRARFRAIFRSLAAVPASSHRSELEPHFYIVSLIKF